VQPRVIGVFSWAHLITPVLISRHWNTVRPGRVNCCCSSLPLLILVSGPFGTNDHTLVLLSTFTCLEGAFLFVERVSLTLIPTLLGVTRLDTLTSSLHPLIRTHFHPLHTHTSYAICDEHIITANGRWPSPAQSFLFSGTGGTHNQIFCAFQDHSCVWKWGLLFDEKNGWSS
jgi:hypothetical protein